MCRKLPCPCNSRAERSGRLEVDPAICIDCGTCSAVCPTGAARRVPYIRSSISAVNTENCYFNPGCAMNLYKHDGSNRMLKLLQDLFGEVKSHNVCCRHSHNFY
ncbi:4Fe-4S binding protein [Enterocloster clostridioformis]|uniref:4Fe-4S binding protein n=1 Tax=Enterocloster clostridioformis TaxID=1531 RepID=UPI003A7F5908